jgi:UPF0716 protein FxsA
VGTLLLLPPTRVVGRPLVAAMAARRVPLVVTAATNATATGWGYDASGRGDYIDGEVVDVQPHRVVERKPE